MEQASCNMKPTTPLMAQNPRITASFTQQRCHGLHDSTSSPRQRCHGLHDSATRPQRRCHGFHARFTHPGGIDGTYTGRAPVIGPTRRILDTTERLNVLIRSRRRQRFRATLPQHESLQPERTRHSPCSPPSAPHQQTAISDQRTPNGNQRPENAQQLTINSDQHSTDNDQQSANRQRATPNSQQ